MGEHKFNMSDMAAVLRHTRDAINPPDRNGISLHEWNGRLRAATAKIDKALAVYDLGATSDK